MAFPTSPTNGQQANINGITYTYSNTVTAWTVSTSVSNSFVSISVSGNVNSGNVLATGVISATGNVLGGNLVVTGNISANNATFTSNQTLSYGTANGVVYLNSNKVATSGTALVFDGTNLGVGASAPAAKFEVSTAGGTKVRITSTIDNNCDIDFYTNSVQRGIIEFNSANGLIFTVPSLPLLFGTNNTERMRVNAGAPILCLSGGNTSATGTGIAFPATQSASADANTLDDYEEGTWTPAITTSGGGFSTTYNTQLGTYVKVGRLVTVWLNIIVGTKSASGSGYLQLTGLPFNIASGISEFGGSVGMSYLWSSNPCICIQPSAGTSSVILNYTFTNNNCSGTDITSGSYFRATVTYQSDA